MCFICWMGQNHQTWCAFWCSLNYKWIHWGFLQKHLTTQGKFGRIDSVNWFNLQALTCVFSLTLNFTQHCLMNTKQRAYIKLLSITSIAFTLYFTCDPQKLWLQNDLGICLNSNNALASSDRDYAHSSFYNPDVNGLKPSSAQSTVSPESRFFLIHHSSIPAVILL